MLLVLLYPTPSFLNSAPYQTKPEQKKVTFYRRDDGVSLFPLLLPGLFHHWQI